MIAFLHLPLLVGSFALLCVVHCTASDTGIMNAVMDNSNTTPGHTTRPIRTNTRASVTLKPPPIIKPSAHVKPSKTIKPSGHVVPSVSITPTPSIIPDTPIPSSAVTVTMVVNASFHESEIRAEIDTLFNDTVSLIRLTCEARPASENSSCIGIFVNRAAANFMVSAVYDSKLSGIYSAEVKLPPVPPVTPTDETFKGKSVIILASVAGGIALIAIIVGLVFYFKNRETYTSESDIRLTDIQTDDYTTLDSGNDHMS
eukprot:Tbor_TRINITY_DN5919_c0_g2::TRINITY_DN5919_c0_g2_i6::g.19108::m.19108